MVFFAIRAGPYGCAKVRLAAARLPSNAILDRPMIRARAASLLEILAVQVPVEIRANRLAVII